MNMAHLIGDDVLRGRGRRAAGSGARADFSRSPGRRGIRLCVARRDRSGRNRLAERVLAQIRTLDVGRWLPGGRVTVSVGITLSVPGDT